jgi:AraC-like DNA-binding protein
MDRGPSNAREYLRLWRAPNVEGVDLYAARLISQSYPKHFHEEYTIGITEAGAGSVWYRGANELATPATLTLLSPGEVHAAAAAGDAAWEYRSFYVRPSLVQELFEQDTYGRSPLPCFRQCIPRSQHGWRIVRRALDVLTPGHSRLEAQTVLAQALRLLFERFADRGPGDGRCAYHQRAAAAARARDYITDRYRENFSLAELAQAAGLSQLALLRSFKRQFGLPPHAYQLQTRLHRAKAELHSDVSLASVAHNHGFFDQSHFNRHFTRAFGVTPGQYRRGNPRANAYSRLR